MTSDTIHLHTINLDVSNSRLQACRELLNVKEVARANRFFRKQHRRRWIVCRASLREVLALHCNVLPGAVSLAEEENGKPVLTGASGSLGMHFNLSHSQDLAIIAVTNIGPVGIDVEHERNIGDWEAIAARFFSPAEQVALAKIELRRRSHAFYCCWTRKEAVVKATGEGLFARLDSFDVSLAPGNSSRLLSYDGSRRAAQDWQIHHLQPWVGYVGALAIRHPRIVTLEQHAGQHSDQPALTGPVVN